MDERILINPDNRFLASSGANDFSLYGAPSDPALTIRSAEADGGGLTADAPQGGNATAGAGDPSPHDIQQSALPAADGAGPLWGSAAVVGRAPDPASPAQAPVSGEAPDAPTALAPAAFGLTAPLAPASADPSSGPAAQVQPLAQLASVDQAEPLAAAVSGPLASLSIDEAVGRAADDVQDLLGTDPAAGIATLVSLVSISDVVDLGDAGTGAADVVVSPVDSMIDALAADPLGALAPDPEEADDGAPAAGTLLGGTPIGGDEGGDLPLGLG
jgi:hypothetical protein